MQTIGYKLAWSLVPVFITLGILMLSGSLGKVPLLVSLGLLWAGLIGMWFGITNHDAQLQKIADRNR